MSIVRSQEKYLCGECGGPMIRTFADLVCSKCGVVGGPVVKNPESYPGQEEPHYGPSKRPWKTNDLGTEIGQYSDLVNLSPEQQETIKRQKKLDFHQKDQDPKERRLEKAFAVLNDIVGVLDVSETNRKQAAQVLRKYEELLKTSFLGDKAGSALYYVLRRNGRVDVPLEEFVKIIQERGYRASPKVIAQMAHLLQLQIGHSSLKVDKPQKYFDVLYSKFSQHDKVQSYLTKYRKNLPSSKLIEHFFGFLRHSFTLLVQEIPDHVRYGKKPSRFAQLVFMGAVWISSSIYLGKPNFFTYRVFEDLYETKSVSVLFRANIVHWVAEILKKIHEDPSLLISDIIMNSIATTEIQKTIETPKPAPSHSHQEPDNPTPPAQPKTPIIPKWDLENCLPFLEEEPVYISSENYAVLPITPLSKIIIPLVEPPSPKTCQWERPYMDHAELIYKLKKGFYLTNKEVGAKIGLKKVQVGVLLALNKLPLKLQQEIRHGELTVKLGFLLSKLTYHVDFPKCSGRSIKALVENQGLVYDFNWHDEPETWRLKRIKHQIEFYHAYKTNKLPIEEINDKIQELIRNEKHRTPPIKTETPIINAPPSVLSEI